MIFNFFIPYVFSSIFSPAENSIHFVNNNLNISWQNNFTEDNINVFLLQDEIIVRYPHNSNILSSEIVNNGYLNWIPPYDLNKYPLDSITFQFLLSNSSNPFSATLGHNQINILGNTFQLKSNINITNPTEDNVFMPNTIININTNGFLEPVNCTLKDGNQNVIDSFIMKNNFYSYNIPQYLQNYKNTNLELVMVENNTGITRIVNNLKTTGINIFPYIINNSEISFLWNNINFEGGNIIEIYYNKSLISNVNTSLNNFAFELFDNYGIYEFIIYDQNKLIFDKANYNYLSTTQTSTLSTTQTSTLSTTQTSTLSTTQTSTLSTTQTSTLSTYNTYELFIYNDTTTNNTNLNNNNYYKINFFKLLIGFLIFLLLIGLLTYCYANDNSLKKKYYFCCSKNRKIIPDSNSAQAQSNTYYSNRENFDKNEQPSIPKKRHFNNSIYDSNSIDFCNLTNLKNLYNNTISYSQKYETDNYNHLDANRNDNNYNHLDANRNDNNYNYERNKNDNLNIEYNNLQSRNNNSNTNLYDEIINYNNPISNSFIYSTSNNNPSSTPSSRQALPNNIYGYNNETDNFDV